MRSARALVLTACAALTLAACVGGSGSSTTTAPTTRFVTVFGPYRDVDADRFVASLERFERATGIEVRYTGTASFATDLRSRVGPGSDPPDVAMVPQLGLVRDLAENNVIVPLATETVAQLSANHTDADRQLGMIGGVDFAVPFRINVKSLIWYRPDVFEAQGLTVPTTFEELEQMAEVLADEGELAPWCLTLQAGTATGWPATDWVEDILLRRSGVVLYNEWAAGLLPFASAPVQRAFDEFDSLVLAPGRLTGGTTYALDNPTVEIFERLLGPEPRCAMAKQGDFAANWLPEGVTVGPGADIDWFVMPGVAPGTPPLVVGGDMAVQFRDAPEVAALMTYLAGPNGGAEWARQGGLITPATSFDVNEYPNDSARALGELVTTATDLVFDASDQMPPDVGTELYWSTISQWVNGTMTFDTLATTLDDAFAAYIGPPADEP